MNLSLRKRLLLLIALINIATFGIGLFVLVRDLDREQRGVAEQYSKDLAYTLAPTIDAQGDISFAPLLRWPNWKYFDDAIIVRDKLEIDARGDIRPIGAIVNPIGRFRRHADLEHQGILRDIRRAIDSRAVTPSHAGFAIPVVDTRGVVWGGCWFALARTTGAVDLVQRLLPWFVLSTLLLTLGTFAVLRRFVLDPVDQLAAGARRVAAGDLSVRIPKPPRRDELSGLIESFNAMTEKVEGYNAELARDVHAATEQVRRAEAAAMTQRRLAATGELAAGIAHEINNPLGGMLNVVEALEKDKVPPEKRPQYFALLHNGLERIQATVGQLLRFTPRNSTPVPLALVDPVADAIALVQHRAEKLGVAIELAGRPAGDPAVVDELRALPPVLGQANELGQAVLNLLVNALDSLESSPGKSPRITIALARAGLELHLRVADNGQGVSADELPRIADLFYTTKDVGKGTGVGLAIVHGIVQNHGGSVQLSSEVGGGFQVEIRLPIWNPVARAENLP